MSSVWNRANSVRVTAYSSLDANAVQVESLSVGEAIQVPQGWAIKQASGHIDIIQIQDKDLDKLVDRGVGQDAVYDNLMAKLKTVDSTLKNIGLNADAYTIEMVDAGTRFMLSIQDATQPFIVTISELTPTYFDLGMIVHAEKQEVIAFNRTRIGHGANDEQVLVHSGDRRVGTLLVHHIQGRFKMNVHHPIVFTGYSRTPLWRFQQHRPVVLVFDRIKHIMYVIAAPLDEATVGKEKVLMMPFGVARIAPMQQQQQGEDEHDQTQHMLIDVYQNPYTDVGSLPDIPESSWAWARRMVADACLDRPVEHDNNNNNNNNNNAEQQHASCVSFTPSHVHPDKQEEEEEEYKESERIKSVLIYSGLPEIGALTCFFQPDLLVKAMTTHAVYTRCSDGAFKPHPGYHHHYDSEQQELDVGYRHFPSLVPMAGGRILFASLPVPALHPDASRVAAVRRELFYGTIPIVILGDMDDASRKVATSQKLNAVYIYYASTSAPLQADMESRRTFLSQINTNAATAYAGPLSITLVATPEGNDQFSFYFLDGGCSFPGLFDQTPHFGDDVTEQVTKWAASPDNFHRPLHGNNMVSALVDISLKQVKFGPSPALMTIDAFKSHIKTLSASDILSASENICDVLSQCQRMCRDDELKQHADELVTYLTSVKVKFGSDQMKQLYRALEQGTVPTKPQTAAIKESVSLCRRGIDAIAQKLGQMVSKQKQTSMKFNLAQMNKKMHIYHNVDRAKAMDFDAFEELMENACGENGALWLNIDTALLHNLLNDMASYTFTRHLIEPLLPLVGYRRDVNIDALTMPLLLQCSAETRQDPLRPLKKDAVVMSTPVSVMTHAGLMTSSFFFPLIDVFAKLKDPTSIKWLDVANTPDIATLRILARDTIANSVATREQRIHVVASDPQVAWLLVYLGMCAIQQLIAALAPAGASSMTEMTQERFHDQLCVNTRCVLGWMITTACCGVHPVSKVFQLFSPQTRPDLPEEKYQWSLYVKVVACTKYAGWSHLGMHAVKKNVGVLLCRLLNKIVRVATESLRTGRIAAKRQHREEQKKHYLYLKHTFYPQYRALVEYCAQVHACGVHGQADLHIVEEFSNFFSKTKTVRVLKGSIHKLLSHARSQKLGTPYIGELLSGIFFKWNNYDKALKVRLYRYAMGGTHHDAITQEFVQDLSVRRIYAFQALHRDANSTPILNQEHIQELLKLLMSDSHATPDDIHKAADMIFYKEDKFAKAWLPFDPLTEIHEECNSNDAHQPNKSYKDAVIASEPGFKYAHILSVPKLPDSTFKKMMVTMPPREHVDDDTMFAALIEFGCMHAVEEYVDLARFAGFGDTSAQIAMTTRCIMDNLFANWSQDGDQAELGALAACVYW